jgi:exodeoxyribonuclease VII large subunit
MRYTVTELNTEIKNNFRKSFDKIINISGESSGCKLSKNNLYFTLKDKTSSISCIIWDNTYNIKDGDQLIISGYINLYLRGGSYNIIVKNVEHNGLGQIKEKYEKLKKEFETKGYFDDTKKKELPKYLKNIGIITAENGAALQDILYVLKTNNFFGKIHVKNCIVQGSNCSKSVCSAIDYFNKQNIDLLIITRGGGSIEDLMGFSDKKVIEKIYNCKICTMSAVGHEVDFMLSDYVADIRAPTPSVAGSLIIKHQNNLISRIDNINHYNKLKVNEKISNIKEKIYKIKDNLVDPNKLLQSFIQQVSTIEKLIEKKYTNKIKKVKNKLNDYSIKLIKYNNILCTEDGSIINSINFFKNKEIIDNLIIRLNDGNIKVKIIIKK